MEENEIKWEKTKAAGKTPAQDFINGEDIFSNSACLGLL